MKCTITNDDEIVELNFPVALLKDSLDNIEYALNKILNYGTSDSDVKIYRLPTTGASKKTIVSFLNGRGADEFIYFLAFLGVKSIVGKKLYCHTNKDFILARANGDRVPVYEIIDNTLFDGEIREQILHKKLKPYKSRKRFDRIKKTLGSKYHVHFASPKGTRGFYVTTRLSEKELRTLLGK